MIPGILFCIFITIFIQLTHVFIYIEWCIYMHLESYILLKYMFNNLSVYNWHYLWLDFLEADSEAKFQVHIIY